MIQMEFPSRTTWTTRVAVHQRQREQANQYFLDGQLNSEDKNNELVTLRRGCDPRIQYHYPNASAEFGNYEGGVISVSTKGGTNTFHGTVFEFLRNDKFNSNLPSNAWTRGVAGEGGIVGHSTDGTILKPEFRYNEFGATIGGRS